jgi:hypothetical protein
MHVEGSGRGPFGRYYLGIRMEPLRIAMAELRKGSVPPPPRGSKRASPEHEPRRLTVLVAFPGV